MMDYSFFEITTQGQTLLFVRGLLFGACMAALYDVLRIYRQAFGAKTLSLFIQDILFFSICGLASFIFMLVFNNGQVRIFIIAAQLIGAIIYRYSIGVLIMLLAGWIINLLRKFFLKAKNKVIIPILKKTNSLSDTFFEKNKRIFNEIFLDEQSKNSIKRLKGLFFVKKGKKKQKKLVFSKKIS